MVKAGLLCLALVAFVVGTDDFVVAGVLPGLAGGFAVSEAVAAQLVTVFSVVYAVAAPVLAMATARLPRRAVLGVGLAVFALANAGAVVASSFGVLMAMRVLAALAGAAVTPVAFAVAAGMAPPGREGRYIGTVAGGLTLALVAGVPVGTWLSGMWGWRATFGFVAVLAGVACLVVPALLPALPGGPRLRVRRRLALLTRPPIVAAVLGTVVGASYGLMSYTYIAPIARELSGADVDGLAVLILVVGVVGAAGTVIGGRLTDRLGADRALVGSCAMQVVATGGLAALGLAGPGGVPLAAVAAVFAGWGLAGWAFNPPMNARLLALAGPAGTEAVALNSSALYLGIAVGGGLGGVAFSRYGVSGVTVAATALGLVTVVLLAASVARYPTRRAGG